MQTNEVKLSGRLTRDPELKTGKGMPYCRFSIAVKKTNAKRPNGDEDNTASDFFYVTCFGQTAFNLCKNAIKGDMIFVKANLSLYKGEQDKYPTVTINANEIMIGLRNADTSSYKNANNNGEKSSNNIGDNNIGDEFAPSDDYALPFDIE